MSASVRWRRFAPLVRAERARVLAVCALATVGIGLEALAPWPLKLIIDNVLGGEPLPAGAGWLAALPQAGTPAGLLAWLAAAVLGVFLALQAQHLAKESLQADLASRLRLALGALAFAQLQALSLVYHRRARRGDLLRRVTGDAGCLATLVTGALVPAVTAALALVVLFAIMWQLDAALALVALLVALPMSLLMRFLGPRMADRAYEHQQAEGAVWSVAEQALTAIPIVQGFGREGHEQTRFRGVADRSIRAYLRTLATQLQFRIGIQGSEALGIAAIMLIGGQQVLAGATSVGTLVVFLGYLAALYAPLVTFAYLASTFAAANAGARRVVEVLDATERVAEDPRATPLPRTTPRGVRGDLRLEGVSFGYQRGTEVLHGIDLDVRAGETVALVGASGAGKSTLVALLPRLYDPWQGRVLIDGQDLRAATLASVRDSVAMVPQDPFLLPLSIAENIAYGRPSATRGEIEAAARAAQADEFIRALPLQYDTVVGERGTTLSGGQRQRLSIARALLKDAPILVMDEPTSALDAATERSVLLATARLMAGRTTIVIAHRLSTVRHADRIVVLDDGRIVATGTHDELVATSARYRILYLSQLAPEAPAAATVPPPA